MKLLVFIVGCSLLLSGCSESSDDSNQESYLEIRSKNDPDILVLKTGIILHDSIPYTGILLEYHSNNTIMIRNEYREGILEGTSMAYYPSGKLRYERYYVDGEKHGIHKGYYENGQIKFRYKFEMGFNVGNHQEWYEDGSLYSDMNYKSGKEYGKQQVWRPDGKLRANYIVRENGRRYGLQGIKRCTKLDGTTKEVDPYKGES